MNVWQKKNVSLEEYNIYRHVELLNIVNIPQFISYDYVNGTLNTQKIDNMCLADYYGDDFNSFPKWIIDEIRAIIKTLNNNGIYYPDITGYNFIEWDDRIWIIDFGHAHMEKMYRDPFILAFIEGHNGWNPKYR